MLVYSKLVCAQNTYYPRVTIKKTQYNTEKYTIVQVILFIRKLKQFIVLSRVLSKFIKLFYKIQLNLFLINKATMGCEIKYIRTITSSCWDCSAVKTSGNINNLRMKWQENKFSLIQSFYFLCVCLYLYSVYVIYTYFN